MYLIININNYSNLFDLITFDKPTHNLHVRKVYSTRFVSFYSISSIILKILKNILVMLYLIIKYKQDQTTYIIKPFYDTTKIITKK